MAGLFAAALLFAVDAGLERKRSKQAARREATLSAAAGTTVYDQQEQDRLLALQLAAIENGEDVYRGDGVDDDELPAYSRHAPAHPTAPAYEEIVSGDDDESISRRDTTATDQTDQTDEAGGKRRKRKKRERLAQYWRSLSEPLPPPGWSHPVDGGRGELGRIRTEQLSCCCPECMSVRRSRSPPRAGETDEQRRRRKIEEYWRRGGWMNNGFGMLLGAGMMR